MFDEEFKVKKNRTILELNLTPLIDAFTVIVLFLILGAVFSNTDIKLPHSLKLPLSISDSSPQVAQQVVVFDGKVSFSEIEGEFSVSDFYSNSLKVRSAIKKYFSSLPEQKKELGREINFTTDQATPYKTVFDVVKVLREEGFEMVMFVAEGEQK